MTPPPALSVTPPQAIVLPGTGEAPLKTRILEECHEHVRSVDAYRNKARRERKKVQLLKRPPVSSFKDTITPSWIENHLAAGGYYRADGTKSLYDDVTEKELFGMYLKRHEKREIPRPYAFLHAQNIRWPIGRSLSPSTRKFLTSICRVFRDSMDYEGILEKAGENRELKKHVVSLTFHAALRERS